MVQGNHAVLTNLDSLVAMLREISFTWVNKAGDIVKAVVTKGKKIGRYLGRIATRSSGSFNISTAKGLIQGISHKYCKHIHKKDGYGYIA